MRTRFPSGETSSLLLLLGVAATVEPLQAARQPIVAPRRRLSRLAVASIELRERCDVDLELSRLVGNVREPFRVGRERGGRFVELRT